MTTGTPSSSLRVLAIDDSAIVLRSLVTLLEVDGHQVGTADSGEQGLQAVLAAIARDAPFDVVVTDFAMPGMDGGELARLVKQARPSTWVVVLTGWGPGIDPAQGWQVHVDTLIGKPPRLATLRAMLAQARGAPSG